MGKWTMLHSIIQIGPEILNNSTEIVSSYSTHSSILEAAVMLPLGLLISLTLRWQLDPNQLYYDSKLHKNEKRVDRDIRVNRDYLIAMFVSASVTVGFALFLEIAFTVLSLTVSVARISFVILIVIVVIFIIRIIHNPPKQEPVLCYAMKLDLLTNATVIDDAIRFVSSHMVALTEKASDNGRLNVEGSYGIQGSEENISNRQIPKD